jgi:hypothetical protein
MPSSGRPGVCPAGVRVEKAASPNLQAVIILCSVQGDGGEIIPEAELRSAGQTGRLPLREARSRAHGCRLTAAMQRTHLYVLVLTQSRNFVVIPSAASVADSPQNLREFAEPGARPAELASAAYASDTRDPC